MSQSPEFTEGGINYDAVFDQLPPFPADAAYQEIERLATPLFEVPSQDQWGTVQPEDPGQPAIRVPFTQPEADAIVAAQRAHRELLEVAASTSGVERDYWMDGASFPHTAEKLRDRTPAVWGMMIAAFAAHKTPQMHVGTAWQASETSAANMTTIAQLPNSLQAHPATS